jgi:hypothetical protein
MSWLLELLSLAINWLRLLQSGVRVKVSVHGPIGLENPPAPYDYTITVRNKSTEPISIEAAGVIVSAPEGVWELLGEPIDGKVKLLSRDSGVFVVEASRVREQIVAKGIYEARLSGFARFATGKKAKSRSMPISIPRML